MPDGTTGLEEKLGNNLGERLADIKGSGEELENLSRSGENVVMSTSEASSWAVVVFGKVSWSPAAASHTVGFSAEQPTSWRRTPSYQKVQ